MAHPDGVDANKLFQILSEWNYVLQYSSIGSKPPTSNANSAVVDDDVPEARRTSRRAELIRQRVIDRAKEVGHA